MAQHEIQELAEQQPAPVWPIRVNTGEQTEKSGDHKVMNFKSHIPFFTVPLAFALLSMLVVDAIYGQFVPHTDIPRYTIGTIWGLYGFVSGLVQWNKPYVSTDERGIMVYGRRFSNYPT